MNKEREALEIVKRIAYGNQCAHENTHRGGAIWTICDSCRAKWADDQGGFKPNGEIPKLDAAFEVLDRYLPDRVEGQAMRGWTQVKEEENNMDGMNEWVLKDEAERRIAATEARVRQRAQLELNDANATIHTYAQEVKALRSTIADLTAKLEGAYQIGDRIDLLSDFWIHGTVGFVPDKDSESGIVTDISNGSFHFRPTPKPMTNEEKAEMLLVRMVEQNPEWPQAYRFRKAQSELLKKFISGKSIDQLIDEARIK